MSMLGGDCQPSLQVLQPTMANESAAIALHQTARRRKRPRRRPGRRNGPRAPNRPHEAIPSHPLPTMGGMSPPTMSAHANDRDHRSIMSSPVPPMTLPSPSHHPFTVEGNTSPFLGGGFIDSFRITDILPPPRKSSRRTHCPRRVCRRHGPRAPNSQDSPRGRRHRPRAPNISPEAS